MKRIDIYERSKTIGKYIVEKNSTVREAAEIFGVSKSTVHKDITDRIIDDAVLYDSVRRVLDMNKEQRASRGGKAAKRKKLQIKKVNN